MSDTTASGPRSQPALFRWLRYRLLVNGTRTLFENTPIRPITILFCSIVVWAFVFAVSLGGFIFLKRELHLSLSGDIVGTLFDFLFLFLGVLLVFSTGLILYASLFGSAETSFLLSRPARDDRVFAYKFQGAVAFSSWAFLLLGGPLLIAYGIVLGAPWYFYAIIPFFFLGFVLLPGSLGGIACLLIVNYVPKRRKQVLVLCGIALLVVLSFWIYQIVKTARPRNWGDAEAVNLFFEGFEFTRRSFVPTHWVARGLRYAARGEVERMFYNLALIWSNGLFLYLVMTVVSARLYRRGYNRLSTGGDLRRKYGGLWMDRLLHRALPYVSHATRLLIVKDFRTFRRDPQQWAQVLIFSCLMAVYSINIRRLFPGDIDWVHQNGISLLNVSTISLLLCTYTGRFVYPLLSLEGRKFWILGLLPLHREQLLWGKFAFSTIMVLGIAGVLVLLSDLFIGMPIVVVLMHLLSVTVLSAGLSGLSVGLGAYMPNFRETDPSKIAVGFGGTLNLVVGLGFLIAILLLMVLPWHFFHGMAIGRRFIEGDAVGVPTLTIWQGAVVVSGVLIGLAVGAASVLVPLRMGSRALREMEF